MEFSAGEIYKNGDHIRRTIMYKDRERKIKEMFPWETYDSINNRGSPYIAKFNKKKQQYILFPDSVAEDYKRYIPIKSNGFTKIGIQYINESIEAFICSILGAQARTKQSITKQEEFYSIVEDSVLNYNTSTWINNMNRTITDTNIILNLAISPSLWLMSNNLIIIKNPIKGFNNKLQVATINMNFGINENLNKMNTQSTLNTTAKSKPQNVIKRTT